ncbi:MAG: SURF1 family protein [Acidimicrobiia bacterium]
MSQRFDRTVLGRPRWIAATAVALAVAAACVLLGLWQLDRLAERRDRNATIAARSVEEARPLAALRSEFNDDPDRLAYRHAFATGTYDTDLEFFSVGRVYGDTAGTLVATPMRLADKSVLIVVRGLVPNGTPGPPAAGYEPRATPTRIEGRLMAGEAPSRIGEPAPEGGHLSALSRLDLDYVDQWVDGEVVPFMLLLDDQDPKPANTPLPLPDGDLTDGRHLGYAVQWFAFAAIAVMGLVALLFRASRVPGASEDALDRARME